MVIKRGQESGERVHEGSLEEDDVEEEDEDVDRERFWDFVLDAMVILYCSPSVLPAHHGAPIG
jgi:hypothetical protein